MENTASEILRRLRIDYSMSSLDESGVDPDPIRQFQVWFQEALTAQVPEPHAMTLATASRHGIPSARIVLLRGVDEAGFSFFTNYESRKGRELDANPHAALVFHWQELERQVRVEGSVVTVPAEESDAYFESRPRGSQVGAWASPQSAPIRSREVLEERFREVEERYRDHVIPRPPHWGGYRVVPHSIEFWQGRPSRLHDRIGYTRLVDAWAVQRLSP